MKWIVNRVCQALREVYYWYDAWSCCLCIHFPNQSLTRFSFSEDAAYVGKNSNTTRYRISQIYASSQREANMPINSSYIFNSSWPGSVHYTLNQHALVSPGPSVSWGEFNGWSFLTHLKCLMSLESFCTYTVHCREMQK